MRFLSQLKFSYTIVILVSIPIIAMIYFALQTMWAEVDKSQVKKNLSQLTSLSVKLSNLVHEQQAERGATAVFVGSEGKRFVQELKNQRASTDNLRAELTTYLKNTNLGYSSQKFDAALEKLFVEINKIHDIRKQVDVLSISKADALSYFTKLNAQNIDFVDYMGSLSLDPKITTRYISYTSFLRSKERVGIERAVGAGELSAGKFTQANLTKFNNLIAAQNIYNKLFLDQATDEQVKAFNDIMASEVFKTIKTMRQTIIKGGIKGELNGLDGVTWFETLSLKINQLKAFEDTLAQALVKDINISQEKAETTLWNTIIVKLATLLFITIISYYIIRNINSAFKDIIAKMNDLAKGNLDIKLPAPAKNEIGQMMKCVEVFKNNAIEKLDLEKQQGLNKIRAEKEKQELMNKMADSFDENVGSIVNNVSQASKKLQKTAQSMAEVSNRTSENATCVSTSSEAASANVQSVAAASEEITQSIVEINVQVSNASTASKNAVDEATRTSKEMQQLSATIEKVDGAVALIASIADQTNLLALNATIESARAGEAGRGFAVVASEVKDLASKTADVTNEITQYINEMDSATKKAVKSMVGISDAIGKVDEISVSVAAAMEEQGYATNEISSAAQEAANGTQEVSTNIERVTQASESVNLASGEVMDSATMLLQQSDTLKLEVKKFTNEIRQTG